MRHVDRGDPELGEKRFQLLARLLAELRVEVAERLVEQDDLGLCHQRPRQRDALLLASRKLGRRAPLDPFELDEAQRLPHLLANHLPALAADLQRVRDVVEHAQVRPDRVGLEHHAEAALLGGHGDAPGLRPDDVAADSDLAVVGRLQADDAAQQRRFAAAAWPEQREDVVGRNSEIDVIERANRPALGPIALAEALDPDLHAGGARFAASARYFASKIFLNSAPHLRISSSESSRIAITLALSMPSIGGWTPGARTYSPTSLASIPIAFCESQ